jgi:hypothetical protein
MLDYLEVGHRKRAMPSKLSDGDARRAAIARALANCPQIILAESRPAALDLHRSSKSCSDADRTASGLDSLPNVNLVSQIAVAPRGRQCISFFFQSGRIRMVWNAIQEWRQKRKLREMLTDPWSTKGFRSAGQLEKGIASDRATTERMLLAIGTRKSEAGEEWTLNPLDQA